MVMQGIKRSTIEWADIPTKFKTKPTVRALNITLRKLEQRGFYSPLECMKERAFFAKAMTRKPKTQVAT